MDPKERMNSTLLLVGVLLLSFVSYSEQESIESLDDVLVYPMEPASKRHKRDIERETKQAQFVAFVEDKLIQHTQALEHLLKVALNTEDILNHLIQNWNANMEQPKAPEKIEELHNNSRRSYIKVETESPIAKIGRKFSAYGMLFKDMLVNEFEGNGPNPVVEKSIMDTLNSKETSRRSFSGPPVFVPRNANEPSPWCAVSVVCQRSLNPICGYDEIFGYGKFDDICHMLKVNCFWKFNFALVPSCRPGT
ncbi:uncharacterized protein LOC126973098 [Leptidea sinapis]|uniref:uncharacterized protein LOC126973098 n=1 Tax=Leptidea sinapis TaxID=189913 RepID=UPI0021C361BE|nr:uncharacterized protein LOC126973098 [Leptidea sinapis]